MYQVVIVEDDADQARILGHMIERSPRGGDVVITHLADAASLRERFATGLAVDILMMDIELGPEDANGIDLVKQLVPVRCGTQVIYVTGFVEYCTSVYRTDHVYFLTKPVAQDDLDDALDRAFERLEQCANKPLSVRFGGKVMLVPPRSNQLYRKRPAQGSHPCRQRRAGNVRVAVRSCDRAALVVPAMP